MKAKNKIYDSVFTKLFGDPKYQQLLYKELHPEDNEITEDDITVITLEAILVNSVYNDLGFTARGRAVFLVEAQSTWCSNMTLRTLIYLAETYKKHVLDTKQNYYSGKPVSIPKPEIYMLYTGDEERAEKELSLADTYFGGDASNVELKVKVLYGDDTDAIISQYVKFTSVYRKMRKQYGNTQETVLKTIEECVERNILGEFLTQQKGEVVDIMMALFDSEINQQMLVNSERAEGHAEGLSEGLDRALQILTKRDGREEEYKEAMLNTIKKSALLKEYELVD